MPDGELHPIGDTLPELYVLFLFPALLPTEADVDGAAFSVWYSVLNDRVLPTTYAALNA
jgi:hypothetical protein